MKTTLIKSLLTVTGAAVLLFGPASSLLAQTTTYRAASGTTSVRLDTATLASAASLTLSGANSTGTPFNANFQVGFPFVGGTDFTFSVAGGFAPVSGSILHSGSVTFNQGTAKQVILGNFRIGFDPKRVGGARTGFFVENTIAPLGAVILFDLKTGLAPAFDAGSGKFGISNAKLLVSSELGAFLLANNFSTTNLAGAEVGEARVDGRFVVASDPTKPEVSIRGSKIIRTTAKTVRLRGRAVDDVAVRRVEFKVNNGPFRKAAGGVQNWTAKIKIGANPVRVTVRSVDAAGNRSTIKRVRIIPS